MVHCNNSKCEYNDNEKCTSSSMYYINKLCMTYRRRANAKELMKQPFNARCHRSGGKYKSDSGNVLK